MFDIVGANKHRVNMDKLRPTVRWRGALKS
jgi:UDP-sulfoquinovose synthase